MNIDDLTYGQLKEISSMLSNQNKSESKIDSFFIGKKVIIRTYSAGVWFGTLDQKSGNEVILTKARRMWKWWAAESISLSAVALHGIKHDKSKIVEAIPYIWLESIEIIPCSDISILSIEGAENVKAQ